MNDYFCTIGQELADENDQSPNPLLVGVFLINEGNKTMKFTKTSENTSGMPSIKHKHKRALKNYNISSYFRKLALSYIIKSLACMSNKSLGKREFPALWKTARVTPIFKEGDKNAKENYRAISVLPIVSRLLKRLVFNQLYQHLHTNDLLAPSQSGFRTLHSISIALLKCTDEWYSGLDVGKYVGAIFVDLKKAFDTVDHQILIQKLAHYGIRSTVLVWFKSYLYNNSQFTRVNVVDSKVKNIGIGVPKARVLVLYYFYFTSMIFSKPLTTPMSTCMQMILA